MTAKFTLPILMLCLSNLFMTFAWYGHLKFKTQPIHEQNIHTVRIVVTLLRFTLPTFWFVKSKQPLGQLNKECRFSNPVQTP